MVGFVFSHHPGGHHIALGAIERIGPEQQGGQTHDVTRQAYTRDGKQHALHETEVERLMRRPVQLISAEPGTLLLNVDRVGTDGVFGETFRYPVIAWALCVDGEIRVVTPNGVNDGREEPVGGFHVEMPDGSIHGVGEYAEPSCADTVEELERHLRPDGSDAA